MCCEGGGGLRDPLDREGMWEEGGRVLERGALEDRMEDFVTEEEEQGGLVGLVASMV